MQRGATGAASAALSPSRPCHRRASMMARRGFGLPGFSPRRRRKLSPWGSEPGAFFERRLGEMMAEQAEGARRGGRVMIEFILIVVVLLLLIGIFVRREVFK